MIRLPLMPLPSKLLMKLQRLKTLLRLLKKWSMVRKQSVTMLMKNIWPRLLRQRKSLRPLKMLLMPPKPRLKTRNRLERKLRRRLLKLRSALKKLWRSLPLPKNLLLRLLLRLVSPLLVEAQSDGKFLLRTSLSLRSFKTTCT